MNRKGFLILLIALLLVLGLDCASADSGKNTIATAPSIELGQEVTESLSKADASNYYKFTLPSAGFIYITFKHDFVGDASHSCWSLVVMDADSHTFGVSQSYDGNVTTEETSYNLGLPAGNYYIRITKGSYYSALSYTFKVNYTKADNWETEFNNSINDSDPISTNTWYNGSLTKDSDMDYFKITLPSDGYIRVSFKHAFVGEATRSYWNLHVLNADNKVYGEYQSYTGNTTDEATSYNIGLPAGNYFIKVSRGTYFSPLDYAVKVVYTAAADWETEFNNSINDSDPISTNAWYNGSLTSDSDNDYFKITLPSDGYIRVSFKHDFVGEPSRSYWNLHVLNADNEVYGQYQSYTGNTTDVVTSYNIGLPAGNYFIKVSHGSYRSTLNYAVKVNYTAAADWETELNNSVSNADPILMNQYYYGTIMSESDNDYYLLKLDENQDIYIGFTHPVIESTSNYWTCAVLNLSGSSLQSTSFQGNVSGETATSALHLTAGTYFVKICKSGKYSSEDYKFKVYEFSGGENPDPATTAPAESDPAATTPPPGDTDPATPTPPPGDTDPATAAPATTAPVTTNPTEPDTPTPTPGLPATYQDVSGNYAISGGSATYTGPASNNATSVTIPAAITVNGQTVKITAIADKAFYKNTKLRTITIGKNIKTIGRSAFYGCSRLQTVKGGAGVVTLRDSAFGSCKVLKTFPTLSKLQTLGQSAFKGCVKLPKFTLGAKVKSIGKNAFNGCKALKTITVKTTKLTSGNVKANAFKGIYSKATFKCPKSRLAAYRKLFVKKGAPKTAKFK